MSSKSKSWKKYGITHSEDAVDKNKPVGKRKRDDVAEVNSHFSKALHQNDRLYRELAESSVDFIYVIDRDFRVIYLNQSGAGALRMRPEEAAGKHLKDLFPADTAEIMINSLSQVFESGKATSKEMAHHFFHGDFYIHITLNPILDGDGKVSSVMGVSRDITELKKAEKAIRNSEEKFRALSESTPAAICILQDGKIKYANPAMETISGYSQDELLSINFIDMVHPDARKYIEGRYNEWMNGIDGEFRSSLMGVRKNGNVCWIDLSRKTIDYQGRTALLLTGIDITERKRAEEAMKEAKMQAELYLDLMGHDISNMHQAALGYLELARDMPYDTRDKFLDKVAEALQRSTQLISNVRKLQKLQDKRVEAYDVDICMMLTEVYKEYAATTGKKVTLNLNGCTHCHVQADDLLYDLFSNLVSNAVRHTGVNTHVSINLDNVREDSTEYCRVLVDDDGSGISDESKKTLFNRSLKGASRVKGMGLGLYIVKALVENYGGRVWVEDRIKGDHTKGARFVVMLPAVEK